MKISKPTRRWLALALALLTLLPFLPVLTSCDEETKDMLLYGKYGKQWYGIEDKEDKKEEKKEEEFAPKDRETHVSKHNSSKVEPHEFNDNGVCTACGFQLYTQGLTYTMNDDNSSYTVSYNGVFDGKDLVIPMKHKGFAVTDIAKGGFKSSPHLVNVTLPETMVEIGDEAFANCTKLCYVKIEGTPHLWRIGAHAFEGTGQGSLVGYSSSVVRFQIPDTVAIIDDYAFSSSGILVLGLPKNNVLEKIGAYAFHKSVIADGSSLTLGKSLTSLGDQAFSPNRGLFELRFTEDCPLTEIPDNVFCCEIDTLFLSSRIERIGATNFSGVKTVILPSDSALTEVSNSAFMNHRNLIEEFLQQKQEPTT